MQRYRLVDALLETGVEFSYAWKDVNVIPARTLPPQALVIAVTPLLDERSVAALIDLRARGHDLASSRSRPSRTSSRVTDPSDRLALRLWRLQRGRAARAGSSASASPSRPWSDETPLDVALEEVRAYRRHARLTRR